MSNVRLYRYTLGVVVALSVCPVNAEQEFEAKPYASIRMGLDHVSADVNGDGLNGRDFLSRVGFKASTAISPGLQGIAQVEYGLRGDNLIDETQNDAPTLRVAALGLQGHWGKVLLGSQTTLWERYVGSSYFSDGNDSVRQHAVRDDDLLQYYFSGDHFSLGAGLQMESQEGDDLDQILVGGEYHLGPMKWQVAYSKDQRGVNKGDLAGARWWLDLNAHLAVSAFTQHASKDYDLYAGSSSGDVRLIGEDGATIALGIPSCSNESRSSSGVFGQYAWAKDTLRMRYAVDACDLSGDVESAKIEYMHRFSKNYNLWLAMEELHNDYLRKPDTPSGDDMAEVQLGLRFDI